MMVEHTVFLSRCDQQSLGLILLTLLGLSLPAFAKDVPEWSEVCSVNEDQKELFYQFRNGKRDPRTLSADESSQLALTEAMLPAPDPQRAMTTLWASNLQSAIAVYAVLEVQRPNYPYYFDWFVSELLNRFPPDEAWEIHAALFAHLKDELSWFGGFTEFPLILPPPPKVNKFAFLARELLARNQPYMHREWQRIAAFAVNAEAAEVTHEALRALDGSGGNEAAFSAFTKKIRFTYSRCCARRWKSLENSAFTLPEPFEGFQIRTDDIHGKKAVVSLLTSDGVLLETRTLRVGESWALPAVDEAPMYDVSVTAIQTHVFATDLVLFQLTPACLRSISEASTLLDELKESSLTIVCQGKSKKARAIATRYENSVRWTRMTGEELASFLARVCHVGPRPESSPGVPVFLRPDGSSITFEAWMSEIRRNRLSETRK